LDTASRRGDATALRLDDVEGSYAMLDERARASQRWLRRQGRRNRATASA